MPVSLFRRWWFWLGCAALLAVLIGLGLWLNWYAKTAITIDVSGNVRHLRTRADTVGEALAEADILIDPEDIVQPDRDTHLKDGMTIHVRKAAVVLIDADGEVRSVRTQKTTPLDILAEQQINVGPYDVVQMDGQTITVLRAKTIQVMDGDQTVDAHTTQPDVARALDDLGLELYLGDGIDPDPSTPIVDGLVIRISRAVPITLEVDGKEMITRSHGPTVADALAAIGIAPVGQDYTIPALDAPLEAGMTIRVVRVTEQTPVGH